MLKSEKKSFVSELESIYQDSSSIIIIHYHGISVAELTALRCSLRDVGASFKVVKNTLSKIAMHNCQIEKVSEMFTGPSAIAYSSDPISAAKGVVEFAKANDNLKIIGGVVNNQVLSVSSIHQLAKLPSLDQLRGKIVGLLQAPASQIAKVVQAPSSALARVVYAYATKDNK